MLPHLDEVTGVFADVVHRLGRSVPKTLSALEGYEGREMEEIFPSPKGVPQPIIKQRWRRGGVRSEDVVFPSVYKPLSESFTTRYNKDYQRCHTVYARRIVPEGTDVRSRVLYIHGYMQPETILEEEIVVARLARTLKREVIQLQPPHHGRRRPKASRFDGEFFWSSDLVRSLEAVRQTIYDARHLLNWMLAEHDQPVGVTGISLGGSISAILTCVEERLAFSCPLIAHMDLAAVTYDAPVLKRMRRELARQGWSLHQFEQLLGSWGWYQLTPLVPKEHIQLFAGKEDRFFPAQKVVSMQRLWGDPLIRWRQTSHMGFIPLLPWIFAEMKDFLDERSL